MIYADYNGSAPICGPVKDYLIKRLQDGPFANPNAIHRIGQRINTGMEKCRKICADKLGTNASNIIFNSGSSEGISHIFHSVLSNKKANKNIIITSGIEHSAVINAAKYYQEQGYDLKIVPCLETGVINLEVLKKWIQEFSDKIALVSIMAANNETGVIQPYREIAQICRMSGVLFFSDTTQLIGKTDFHFDESQMDFAVLAGHKIGGLTGTGIVLAKNPVLLKPHVFGGGQEKGLRGGTQNYIGIEALAVALENFHTTKHQFSTLKEIRIQFEKNIKKKFPQVVILGEQAERLASTTLIGFPGLHGQAIQIELESHNIFVTTSSACSDNEPATSKVLKAMNINDTIGRGVVRISLGACSCAKDYQEIERCLVETYNKLTKIKSY